MYNGKRWFCLGLLTFVIAVFGPCPRAPPLSWIMTTQKEKEKRRKKIFVCIIYTHSNIMHSTEYKYLIYDVILHTSLNHINHIVYVVIEYAQTFRYDLYYSICITALECSVNQHIYLSLCLSLSVLFRISFVCSMYQSLDQGDNIDSMRHRDTLPMLYETDCSAYSLLCYGWHCKYRFM